MVNPVHLVHFIFPSESGPLTITVNTQCSIVSFSPKTDLNLTI